MRENVRLRRGFVLRASSPGGVVASYIHGQLAPGLGRIAAAVALEGAAGGGPLPAAAGPALAELGTNLAMHGVGMRSAHLDRASIPADVLARERAVLEAQARALSFLPLPPSSRALAHSAARPAAVLRSCAGGQGAAQWEVAFSGGVFFTPTPRFSLPPPPTTPTTTRRRPAARRRR
jgi:translation elongation factor EF-Ts